MGNFVIVRGERMHSIQKRQRWKKVSEREGEQRMIGTMDQFCSMCCSVKDSLNGLPSLLWLMCYGDYRFYIEEMLERSF